MSKLMGYCRQPEFGRLNERESTEGQEGEWDGARMVSGFAHPH